MKKYLFMLSLLLTATLSAQEYTWKTVTMDASRTGCVTPMGDNIKEAIGEFDGSNYIAPNGKIFKKKSSAAQVAHLVYDAQPVMAKVKEVVGYSPEFLRKGYPESKLSNWAVDIIMEQTQKISGKPVHMGVLNFGGII